MNEYNTSSSWIILNEIEYQIKRKIESIGTPLSNWNININRGIITGLNEAFIISEEIKNELIEKDPKSAEIIRPILRGRDITRYEYTFSNLWIIVAKFGSHEYLENKYPAVYKHLVRYEDKLKQRGQCRYTSNNKTNIHKPYPGQHHWLELDNNPSEDYLDDLNKQKIVWGNLCLDAQFAFVGEEYYISAPATMIVPGNKYILAVLNSIVGDWYIRQLGVTRNGGYFEYKPMFVEKLPVPIINSNEQEVFVSLVDKILTARNAKKDTELMEEELNKKIFSLYNFSEEEIQYLLKS